MNKQIGLYVHIPFCNGKCPYCDFYSECDLSLADAYTEALLAEMAAGEKENVSADTLYLGGGTPPLLGARNLVRIIDAARRHYSFAGEATLEANPCSVTEKMLSELREARYNRISFGMQSAAAGELAVLGRKHTSEQVHSAVESAKRVGFDNLSLDLMLGVPYQTSESIKYSLDTAIELDVQHISAYMLKIEENTDFYRKNRWEECPDEEQTCEIYLSTIEYLRQAGFMQYEISNFAKPGMECRHNLKYWRCEEYLGFGPAAHGYFGGARYGHSRDLKSYLFDASQTVSVTDDAPGSFAEYAMLRLRLTDGILLSEAENRYGEAARQMAEKAKRYESSGLLIISPDRIALTPQGFLVSNELIGQLVL